MAAIGSDEPYYCHQQINIPPELPDIMKQFTKAAIRSQPKDVLAWCAAYFRAMANGEIPPVKERIDMPYSTQKSDTGLTVNILKMLHSQLGPRRVVSLQLIEEKWRAVQLPMELFQDISRIGGFFGDIEWINFLAVAASSLAGNLPEALKVCCEVLTHDPEGGACKISLALFRTLYEFLARNDGSVPPERVAAAIAYLEEQSEKQNGYVQPRYFDLLMATKKQSPSDFLKLILGKPVVVKLNSGTDYRGILTCLDGFMNIALEQTEEYQNGELKNRLGDCFIRGNNVLYISAQKKRY